VRYNSVGTTGGLRGRKRSLYFGGTGTPFIARWPGKIPAGKTDKTSVITGVDILPTLLAAANIPLPKGYQPDGVSVLPALKGQKFTRTQPIFWEWRGPYNKEANWPQLAMLEGDMKLLMSRDPKRVELYNVVKDRSEQNNIADAHPKLVNDMMKKLLAWKATLPPDTPGANKRGGKKEDDDN
jgi:arylsulfatase A-like enzyme